MQKSNRAGLLASSMLIGAGMSIAAVAWSAPGFAQQEEEPPVAEVAPAEEADESAEVITVTGSRLRRDAFTAPSPLQLVEGDLSRNLGLIDAADLVQQTSVVQGLQFDVGRSTSAGVNPTDVPSGPGSANIDLRGLSVGRTLVMVNGRRLSPAGVRGAPSAPDVNLIPGTMIERVEILLDGASSIYGSDAVAGVVNYILRDDFEGLELNAFQSVPEIGAGRQTLLSALFGNANDSGYINVAAEWTKSKEVTLTDMADFYPEQFEYCSNRQWHQDAAGNITNSQCGNGAIGSRLLFGPFIIIRDPSANVEGLPPGYRQLAVTPDALTAHSETADDLLIHPEDGFSYFHPRFERLSLFSSGEYDTGLYGGLTAYFEASYSKRDSFDLTHGQGSVPIPADFVANPFPDTSYILFYRNNVENETTVDQGRFIGGLRGDLPFMGSRNWYWDAYASYSRSDGFDRVQGLIAGDRYAQFIETAHISPATGELACDPIAVDDDFGADFPVLPCVAVDLFDPFFLDNGRFQDEDANRYFFPNRMERTRFEQVVFNAFAGGELFDLPGGPLQGLIGVEYREDKIRTVVDAATSEGEFDEDAFADRGATGQRYLTEAFVEVEAPLVADQPLAEELSLNLAARWTEEELFGAAWTYAVRGRYRPNEWLTFRGTYGTSFRAPDVGEQFGSQLLGFSDTRGAGDPCLAPGLVFDFFDHDGDDPDGNGENAQGDPATPPLRVYNPALEQRSQTVLNNCINGGGPFGFPGVDPTTLGTIGAGTNNLAFIGVTPLVAEGSNPELDPETSTSWTAGFVIEQPWFDAFDLRFAATYFDIKVEDAVRELDETFIVSECYNDEGLDDAFCALMTRSSLTGNIDFVNAQLQNIAVQTAKGVDLNATANFEFSLPGTRELLGVDIIANATRALENDRQEAANVPDVIEDLYTHGFPEWRANLTGILSLRDAQILWRTRYMSPTIEDNADLVDEVTSTFSECVRNGRAATPPTVFPANPPTVNSSYCISQDKAGNYFVHDLAAAYSHDTWTFRAGVNNVFDDTPPNANIVVNGVASLQGLGYDLLGRTYFVNVTKSF